MEGRAVNILLVEDDELDIENIQRAFQRANVSNPMWIARDGQEALDMLRGGELPKERLLVLLDLNLPKLSGIEVIREIRLDPALAALSIVVLTTSNEDQDRMQAYGLHVAGYLLKPVTFVAFVDLMATLNRYWQLVEFPVN